MRYSTVLFDVGETLVQVPNPAPFYQSLLAAYGCAVELPRMEEILTEARQVMEERIPRWVSDDLVIDRRATRRRRQVHVDTIIALVGAGEIPTVRQAFYDLYVGTELFALYPDVRETLEWLRSEGYQLGVVSNWEERLWSLLTAHGIADFFQFAVVSEVEGYTKPHPELYRRALERARAPADQVVHVGDALREDMEGAAQVGIQGVLLDRTDAAHNAYSPRIASLRDLPHLLNSPP